jgi:Flp pilus assembly protein TadG
MRFWTIAMKMLPSFTRKEKGQSLVELAMVFTLLLLLFTGIIDVGSMFYTYTALRDTSQEGAIYGSLHPTDQSLIADHIKKSANYPIDSSNITDISVTCSGAACVPSNIYSCQGQKVTVEVRYTYNLIMPIIPVIIGHQSIVLSAVVTDTILQSPDTIDALKKLSPPQTCP